MTESTDSPTAKKPAKKGGLSSMLLADLKSMAGGLGIAGAGSMKKAQLVDAIKSAQGGARPAKAEATPEPRTEPTAPREARTETARETERETQRDGQPQAAQSAPVVRTRTRNQPKAESSASEATAKPESESRTEPDRGGDGGPGGDTSDEGQSRQRTRNRQQGQQADKQQGKSQPEQQGKSQPEQQGKQGDKQPDQQGKQGDKQQGQQGRTEQRPADHDDDGEGGSRRNRRRRGRDRDRDRQGVRPLGGDRNEPDTTVLEDDVLVPAAGILDVLDNYAFVRTSGYLPGTDDVYLSLSMVRKFGLRRGDAVVGQVRQPREGERKEKFNPMVRIDSVNGTDPEAARERLDFETFTPVHPTERLRQETTTTELVGRAIDIAAPIGKGQRGLLIAPPKTGRTTVLRSIAQSISRNDPDAHLMVVLLDARPEEVTDFQREIKGEVIASTFDRPAGDHTMVAELAIERAKRLVELGHDVVLLLDSLTSLGRAYNLSVPPSGRTLAGGVDAAAVHPPKRLFGAARNVEGGGSLTVLATLLVETGSATDAAIFEEFGGTANMELRLSRELAEQGVFPAIDFVASGTRHDALLSSEQEVGIVASLRASMSGDRVAAVRDVLTRLGKAQNNISFLSSLDSRRR
ncbi:transcription termination factor Rho [Nocardioides piscis]|uniref:Transcription termination factor Rho n=1 Tax=Nocardioides piscis TaxID=2714938 RepID=A0A6G7YGG7_9ACTN|nr:transcription termination factor Rho [Nocardioides piscis]QIK75905.1 transcription termination factor Rho [Nocardioides piscis]